MTTQATKTQEYAGEPRFTAAQQGIIHDICSRFEDIDAAQISFEGDDTTPIFDYEAICVLSLALTDIRDLDCEVIDREICQQEIGDFTGTRCTAKCTVTLPDGRTRSITETACVGEEINGRKLATVRDADGLAQNRASRRGIRSVGVNLWRAFLSGKKAAGSIDVNPRNTFYNEIHVLAAKCGLIVDSDRSLYEGFIASSFDGITSAKDLDDQQLVLLRNSLRALAKAISPARSQPAV